MPEEEKKFKKSESSKVPWEPDRSQIVQIQEARRNLQKKSKDVKES